MAVPLVNGAKFLDTESGPRPYFSQSKPSSLTETWPRSCLSHPKDIQGIYGGMTFRQPSWRFLDLARTTYRSVITPCA